MDKEKDLEIIREQEEKGRVSMMNIEGLVSFELANFVKQPAEGILYDLNRDKVTTLSRDDIRWINDYAVAVVIAYLKSEKHEKEITKKVIGEWAEGKVYQEEELKAINDCCKWLNKEDNQ